MAKRKRVTTTKDLLEATGVGQPTLYKWITKGILPPAERRVSSGTGDGVHARWPPGALARARWARKQRDAGLALDEIAALVERGEAPLVGSDAAD
jgi:DNA-binding transcriptional MerR regulator